MNLINKDFTDKQPNQITKLNISIIVLISVFFLLILTIIFLIINSQSIGILLLILALTLIALAFTFFVFNKLSVLINGTFIFSHNPVSDNEAGAKQIAKHQILINDHLNEKEYFSRILSHDLRSPLSSIILITSMIRKGNKHPDILPFLEMIEKSAKKELNLVDNLLALTKLDSEPPELYEQMLLKDLIDVSLSQVNQTLKTDKINLQINVADDLKVFVNPNSFGLVLNTLLMNAIHFSGDDKTVEINTRLDQQDIFLEIKGNKPGFNQKTGIPSFESTTLTNKSSYIEPEQGIGLYFCSKIMQNLHGTIHAYDGGSAQRVRFELILPRPE